MWYSLQMFTIKNYFEKFVGPVSDNSGQVQFIPHVSNSMDGSQNRVVRSVLLVVGAILTWTNVGDQVSGVKQQVLCSSNARPGVCVVTECSPFRSNINHPVTHHQAAL